MKSLLSTPPIDVRRSSSQGVCHERLQLALNVADLDEAVEFYSKMFGVGPAKTKPGYANFAIDQPPLKLVLFEGAGETGTINHLGVETEIVGRGRRRRGPPVR